MEWFTDFLASERVTIEYGLRLLLSLVIGGVVGIEREIRNQAAGLRTHVLICVGATVLMILSISIANSVGAGDSGSGLQRLGDPGRIAAQVVSGIGFIGAGTVMRLGASVRGLTTAASIWTVAALGLAIGAGAYFIAIMGALIVMFTLIVLSRLERRMFPDRSYKALEVNVRDTKISTDQILHILTTHGISVSNVDVTQAVEKKTVKMRFLVKIAETTDLRKLYKDINSLDKVYQVKLEQPM